MTNHGVFRSDLMSGTTNPADLVSVKYMGTGSTATAIDNGCVVKLDGFVSGSREIHKGVKPAKATALEQIVIIGTPEVMYDTVNNKNLSDFQNEAGAICRGFIPRSRNVFSVTAEALSIASSYTPAVGSVVELTDTNKMSLVATLTQGSTQVGKVIAIETTSRYTYYVIEIA